MYAIGNGESRKAIDISSLPDAKVGCNAIFRDYYVDYLICVDRRMVDEAINKGANQNSLIYTRNEWFDYYNKNYKRIRLVPNLPYAGSERPDDPWHWGSGPYAVLLAAKICKDRDVKLIGFDLYSKTKQINNLYKSTKNYDDASKRAVDPRYWIHQIGMVFQHYPKVSFTIYQEDDWNLPNAWKKSNVKLDKISNISYNN